MQQTRLLILASVFLLAASVAVAQQQSQARDDLQQGQVYGWQLMSDQERYEYQHQMREMKTVQEREVFRKQHHEEMQKRARQQGITLPENPTPYRKGMGHGNDQMRRGKK